ncbi:MAG: transposase [Thermoplasmataceae archaeon]|jgi:putative transposase
METALLMNIRLIFLPPYSPDLNPLEFIWKSIRRVISTTFIDSEEKLRAKIDESFQELSGRLTFAKSLAKKFLEKSIIV